MERIKPKLRNEKGTNRYNGGIMDKVTLNPLILKVIFRHLELKSLQIAKSVCRAWTREATLAMDDKFKIRHFPIAKGGLGEVANFIIQHRLNHSLQVSLFNCPWFYSGRTHDMEQRDVFYRQHHNVLYQADLKNKFLRPAYTHLIVELRLEQMLRNHQSDVDLLVSIVSATKNLKRLALDFVRATNKAIQAIPEAPFDKLKQLNLFSFRIHGYGDKKFQLASYRHLLKLCNQVKYLDLRSWDQNHWVYVDDTYYKCVQALGDLCRSDGAGTVFNNLEGLRALRDYYNLPLNIPRRLKHLWLMYSGSRGYSVDDVDEFIPVISSIADSLETIQFYTNSSTYVGSRPLPCLPLLQHFGISAGNSTNVTGELSNDSTDFWNFRSIFMMGQVPLLFPSLTSLVVELPEPDREEYLRNFFPPLNLLGEPILIPQLTYLGISFIGNCSLDLLQTVQKMFPNLKTLKHFREIGRRKRGVNRVLLVCEHRYQTGKNVVINASDSLELCSGLPGCNYSPLYDKLKPPRIRDIFFS